MGRVRITRPFVLLALVALLAPRAVASRTSVWERNPPASITAKTTDAAGQLVSLAPATAADIEAEEPPRFDLGDVVLVEQEPEREEHFDLGPLTLVDLNLLRGPPPSYPETRVGGFELLPPFRVGASPSLSLWRRQACGFSCREVASDSRYDPWGLAVSVAKNGTIVISDERSPTGGTYRVSRAEAEANRALLQNALVEMGGLSPEESDRFVADHDLGVRTEGGRAQAMGALTSGMTERWLKDAARLEAEAAVGTAVGYGAGKAIGLGVRWGMGRIAGTRAGEVLTRNVGQVLRSGRTAEAEIESLRQELKMLRPNAKGKLGQGWSFDAAVARGEEIAGEEVDLIFSIGGKDVPVRADVLTKLPGEDTYVYIESKFSGAAPYQPHQVTVIPELVKAGDAGLVARVGPRAGNLTPGAKIKVVFQGDVWDGVPRLLGQ